MEQIEITCIGQSQLKIKSEGECGRRMVELRARIMRVITVLFEATTYHSGIVHAYDSAHDLGRLRDCEVWDVVQMVGGGVIK